MPTRVMSDLINIWSILRTFPILFPANIILEVDVCNVISVMYVDYRWNLLGATVQFGKTLGDICDLCLYRSSSRPARTKSAPLHLSQTSDTVWSLRLGSCPVALRGFMLGEEGQTCRCSRHKISYITDIEYDKFIQRHVPIGQMVIVSVVSSL